MGFSVFTTDILPGLLFGIFDKVAMEIERPVGRQAAEVFFSASGTVDAATRT